LAISLKDRARNEDIRIIARAEIVRFHRGISMSAPARFLDLSDKREALDIVGRR